MREAATKAGFKVLRVIPEPAAAALAYGISQEKPHTSCYCLVYRVGGATMDVTLMRACEGLYSVVGYVTDDSVGGDMCTDLLVDFFAIDFKKFFKCDVRSNPRSLMKLHSAAETCKHILSTLSTSQCFVESIYDGMDFTSNVTRARFDSLIQSVQSQYLKPLETVLNNAQLKSEDIDKVILVGGSTKTPKFQQLLSEHFPNAEILNSIAADEVVAMGASIQAAIVNADKVQNGIGQAMQLDVLTKGLYIKLLSGTDGPGFHCMVSENTPVPVVRHHRVTTPAAHHGGLVVEVWEGARELELNAETGRLIAKLVLRDVSPGGEVQVSLEVTSEGCLRAAVTDKKTGTSESLSVPSFNES
jgi:molecular chaperone DnaK (HSP70)